jgi:LacI family transcriptional regulator
VSTIREVADRAGVSPSTVSRVLNGHTVDPAMVVRVEAAVEELDYRPSRVARSLRTQTTMVWALVISDIRNPFFTDMARGVEDAAAESGYSVVLCNADEDPAKESAYLELAHDERMAGCIISPADAAKSDVSLLTRSGTPVVMVDRAIDGADLDLVRLDNCEAAAHATRHLIYEGFTRIGCITGPAATSTGRERAAGYLEAIGGGEDLLRWGDFRIEGGYAAAQSLLRLPVPPDALLVGNNLMMIGTLRAITDAGRSHHDIGIIGFDELPWADLCDPQLSTIGQPTYEIGRTAAELLLRRIDGDSSPTRQVTLESRLHVRASSRSRRETG